MDIPKIPLAVVEFLEAFYPNRVPDASTPEFEKNALAGEQRVVQKLRQEYTRQQPGGDTDN